MKKSIRHLYIRMNQRHPRLGTWLWHLLYRIPRNRVQRKILGKHNRVEFAKSRLTDVTFDIRGNGNRISIEDDCILNGVVFYIRGDNHRIDIGRKCRFSRGGLIWLEDSGGILRIGEASTFEDVHLAITEPGSRIEIGQDCMFAYDIDVRTGDSHAIYAQQTGKRINPAMDVSIGNHVWVAAHSIILKGVSIPDDCVIASGAVVTRAFTTPGTVIGGNPARELKHDITWGRERFARDR